jgi:hypothetical protein
VILALDLNYHLRTLPDLQLHFPQLEESSGGYQYFFLVFETKNLKEVVRVGRGILTHVDVEHSEPDILMVSFDSVLFGVIVLGRLVLLFELIEGDTAIHLQYFAQKSAIFLLNVEIPHDSFSAFVVLVLTSFPDTRALGGWEGLFVS